MSGEPTELEKSLAELLRRFRATEIEPLRQRIATLERDLANERRISALEQRLGIENATAARLILPEHRNGGGHGGNRDS